MSKPARTSLGRKILKISGILFGSVVVLVLVVSVLLLTLLEPYVERFVKKQVVENTDGLYAIDFTKLQLNLLAGSLTVEELQFGPDTARHRQLKLAGDAQQVLVQVQTPSLKVTGIRLLHLLLAKQLKIGTILLHHPEVTLLYDETIPPDTIEKASDNELADMLQTVRIGKIHIPGATVRHVNLPNPNVVQHQVNNITLRVKDLQLDSLDQPDFARMFKADDVQLQIRDFEYQSPDSVYFLTFGALDYSSAQGEFTLKNTRVRSDNTRNLSLPAGKAYPTLLDLQLPLLAITGFDAVEAYRTRQLQVKQVHLEQATAALLQNLGVQPSSDSLDLAGLYQEVSPFLRQFTLDEFKITEARLEIREQQNEVYTTHQLDAITLAIQNIQVDSATVFSPRQNFFADDVAVTAKNYCFQHPQSPYILQAQNLQLTTSQNAIKATNLHVAADWRKNDKLKKSGQAQPVLYNLTSPKLLISRIDLIKAFKTKKLAIGSIRLESPDIHLIDDLEIETEDPKKLLQENYHQMAAFITELQLGELSLQNATFSLHTKDKRMKPSQRLEHASVVASGFKIDSAYIFNTDQEIPINDIVVAATDYTFQLPDNPHTFKLASLRYSTRRQELTARILEVRSDQEQNNQLRTIGKAQTRLFDVEARQLHITGLDIVRAYNTGNLQIDQLILSQPELTILQNNTIATPPPTETAQDDTNFLFGVLNEISVNSLRLDDGTFTYRNQQNEVTRTQVLEHASAAIKGLYLTPAIVDAIDDRLPLKELLLSASDYTYRSPDSLYTLKLGSMQYSSQSQELVARSINLVSDKEVHKRLKQENRELANRNLFDLSAEHFKITGLDLIRAYETGRYTMSEIRLNEPEVGILQDQHIAATETDAAEAEAATDRLNKMVDAFRVRNINITDGTFRFNILQDTLLRSQTVEHVSLALEQFRLVNLQASDPLDMFYVEDIGLLIRDYAVFLPDSLYQLQVKEIRTSLNDQAIYIDSLRLIPLFDKEAFTEKLDYSDDRFDVTVPTVKVLGINLNALYNYQDIMVKKLLIQDVEANIYRDNRLTQDPNRRPYTLQKMLRQVDQYLAVDTVLLERTKLSYAEIAPQSLEEGYVVFNDLKLEILNVTNDDERIAANNVTTAYGSTNFMDAGKLEVTFKFHLDHHEDLYTYDGTLEQMNFKDFNPLLENIMGVRVTDGQVTGAAFSVTSTEHEATGNIDFLYEDLKIQLLKKDDKDNPGFFLNAGSWLINNLVIKSNNPAGRREPRKGPIEAPRDYQKSVFNHMSKAMIDGITSNLTTPFVEKVIGIFISD
ncbi:hypothetical protein FVR03_12065 [Pontibacter qinzhouensis]|uniref:Uncharacterized protein n=1 Tax=Pontibacter qinzhouensis TaxID=2603253 RepID=A0A5C8K8R2_9BACT|nr:hypothetical protein [Pontibacter qinzhouensis]TXK45749.1 hypothetical protein FVR03_12065 [Pontibacter qinzhouensis]